jgi:F-type H+-transporting ATPase subunit alpha
MPAEEQVCVIYAGVRGHLDKVLTSEIPKFEKQFLEYLKMNSPKLLADIGRTGKLMPEQDEELKNLILTFLPESGLQMKA